jgi:hypothetical protein
MNCESVLERLSALSGDELASMERRRLDGHVAVCEECRSAIRAAEAMRMLREQPVEKVPEGLFGRVMKNATGGAMPAASNRSFWLGAGVGGSLAAAIAVVALTLGLVGNEPNRETGVAQFGVSMEEARDLNVAIRLGRDLPGATLSVFLSGGVELAGFGDRRELVWTTDLDQGINKLTLPVLATDVDGGRVIVKLDHDSSHQLFVVNLNLDS